MDHPKFIVLNQKEESNNLWKVKQSKILFLLGQGQGL